MSSNINLPIYMDYASTTPVDPRVAKKISDFTGIDFFRDKHTNFI